MREQNERSAFAITGPTLLSTVRVLNTVKIHKKSYTVGLKEVKLISEQVLQMALVCIIIYIILEIVFC